MQLFTVMFRTLFFYFFITLAYRIMGKREVGQLGIIDLIVSILIAELAVISIENYDNNFLFSVIRIVATDTSAMITNRIMDSATE